jgi:hypothetical protein
MVQTYNWSSREEWAQRVRTVYADDGLRFGPSTLSSYASADEIEQAIFELKCEWSRCGLQMRKAKKAAGPLAQQPGETPIAYVQRYYTMSEAEQDLSQQVEDFRRERKVINKVIRGLRDDELISEAHNLDRSATLTALKERWRVLWKQRHDEYVEMIANTPIDDAAWEEELQRRREIENPEIERVNVGFHKVFSTG